MVLNVVGSNPTGHPKTIQPIEFHTRSAVFLFNTRLMKISDLEPVKELLDALAARYNTEDFVADDPVQFAHRFDDQRDAEIASLLVSSIAWGKRSMILRNADRMLALLENEPYHFVIEGDIEAIGEANIHRTFFGRHLRHYLIHGLLFIKPPRFRKELVGIAYHLLFKCLRTIIARRKRQPLFGNVLCGQSGARVSLADSCHGFIALAAHDFGAQTPVKQIGRFAVAMYARCVGHEDADVVEHGGAVQKLAVEMQFGMAVGHSEGFSGHLAAMVKQQAAQFVVGGIVLADDFFSSH